MTIATTQTTQPSFFEKQLSKVAWKRTLIIGAAIGILGAVGNSRDINSPASAFGYAVGYGGAMVVMASGATVVCGKCTDS